MYFAVIGLQPCASVWGVDVRRIDTPQDCYTRAIVPIWAGAGVQALAAGYGLLGSRGFPTTWAWGGFGFRLLLGDYLLDRFRVAIRFEILIVGFAVNHFLTT